jgi:beta-glucosidase
MYYRGEPLFSFGSGLSLTTFEHSCSCDLPAPRDVACSCEVKNVGTMAGDEVVLVFDALSYSVRAAVNDSHPVPTKRLIDFERTSIAAGAKSTVVFRIPFEALALTTSDGSRKLYGGAHDLVFSRGNGVDANVTVSVPVL